MGRRKKSSRAIGYVGCLGVLVLLCFCAGLFQRGGQPPSVPAAPDEKRLADTEEGKPKSERATLADVLARDGRGDTVYVVGSYDVEGTAGLAGAELAKSRLIRPKDAYFHLLGQEKQDLGNDRWRVGGMLTAYDQVDKWLYVRYVAVVRHAELSWFLESCDFKEEQKER